MNSEGIIKGVSRDFFRMMNFSPASIDLLIIERFLYDMPASLFFSITQFTVD